MVKSLGIKVKLILVFILIKCIPLIIIGYLAIIGVNELNQYFTSNTKTLFEENKKLIESTASNAIEDSIKALDKTSQNSLEKLSVSIANQVAEFLYERDNDLLFLSQLEVDEKTLKAFYYTKQKDILVHGKFVYNDGTNAWEPKYKNNIQIKRDSEKSSLIDNEKEFNYFDPIRYRRTTLPIYKEITYFNLQGQEIYKVSSINKSKLDISKQNNTYIKAEDYFSKIKDLNKGDIYVSDVIGAYVPSKIIGTFTKQKAKKMGVEFKPEEHGYAGVENPNGKRFEGIIRFVTPIVKGNKKIGYVSLALDHRHIMEYTDTFNPVEDQIQQNIANARDGNYVFMWDKEGRNISHPRDYFIVGFDPKTGKRVPGWLSKSVADDFKNSAQNDLNQFLESYPKFKNQSLQQKPNLAQLKQKGEIGLDCRYLNFAPQCEGWMQVTKHGGYGSFVIYWSKVWKLTTAASIPYYTGHYGSTKRGFGFITMGANVDEFHEAANKTKENIDEILEKQNIKLKEASTLSSNKIDELSQTVLKEFTFVTFVMVILVILIAIWMSNYITSKIQKLIEGTQKFDNNRLDYRIEVTSKDEIGQLENAFNVMASKIEDGIKEQKEKEMQLIQKSKMASMGDMLGVIIHQWKQPLSVIRAKSSSLSLSLQIEQEVSKQEIENILNDIDGQVIHMSDTMNDFREFFKPTSIKHYELTQIVHQAQTILNGIYRSRGITMNIIEKNSCILEGAPNELVQVLINILNNARDVILENNVSKKVIDVEIDANDKYGIIKITDYAGGIPKAILPNIFDAYFTTKSDDKGTGIGLDISNQIIKKAGGSLEVENISKTFDGEEYFGACFIIKLEINKGKNNV